MPTLEYHLMIYSANSFVTNVRLTEEQFQALKPFLGVVDNDDHFGSYPLEGVSIFVEEHV